MMRTRPVDACPLCQTTGVPLYEALRDRLYGTPGTWRLVRCPNAACALWWLNPMPIAEDLGMAYQTYYTHEDPAHNLPSMRGWYEAVKSGYLQVRRGYGRETGPAWGRLVWWLMFLHPGGGEAADALAMYMSAPRDGKRLLDVGCGSGYGLARMQQLGWDVQGMDVDPAAVEHARRKGLRVQAGALTELNYPPASFDVVHSAHVIEHVPDPRALLRACHPVLRAGGRLVLRTPNTESLGMQRFGEHTLSLDPPRHLMLYNSRNLADLVTACGFVVDRVETIAAQASGVYTLSRDIEREGGTTADPSRIIPGLWFQVVERARGLVSPTVGEELLLTARRP
jgi:2-polyprenyl-3-methyl-5-hydroxy-6-metoxy-1,4-benzoquinol methylase